MPRITYSQENKKPTTNYDYPKLKLKKDEYARLLLIEPSPVMEYVHTLNKPKVVLGKPVMVKKQRRDQTEYDTYATDFVSRPLCLGDEDILAADGVDPKNCPVCALAKEDSAQAAPPQRRFATHVIRYKTKNGSPNIAVPFSAEVLVWSFTERTFGKIADLAQEWGDMREHDVILLCENEAFQGYDMSVSPRAEWLADEERQKLVKLVYKENQIPDLTIACGSRKELRWLNEDVKAIRDAWNEVHMAEAGVSGTAAPSLDEGLSNLFNQSEPKQEKASAPAVEPEEVTPFDSVRRATAADVANAENAVYQAPASQENKISAPAPSGSTPSLEDLLADLGDMA